MASDIASRLRVQRPAPPRFSDSVTTLTFKHRRNQEVMRAILLGEGFTKVAHIARHKDSNAGIPGRKSRRMSNRAGQRCVGEGWQDGPDRDEEDAPWAKAPRPLASIEPPFCGKRDEVA